MECVVVTAADVEVATAGRRVRGTCGLGLYPQASAVAGLVTGLTITINITLAILLLLL